MNGDPTMVATQPVVPVVDAATVPAAAAPPPIAAQPR